MADTISLKDFLDDFNKTIQNLNTTTETTIPSIKGAELAIKDSTEADNKKYELINKVLKDVYSIDISMIEILDVDSSDRFFIEIRYTSLDNIYRRIKLADYRKMLSKSEAEITDYFRDILEYLLGGVVTFNVDYETYNERLEEIIKKYENKDGYEKDIEEILKSNKNDKKDTLIILARICVAYAIKARDKYKYEYDTLGWRNFNNEKVFVYADKIYKSDDKEPKLEELPAICVNDNRLSISVSDISSDYANMIYDLMHYHTKYPAIIISAALSGVVRQLLELGNEAGININICGTSGCGKTTIENIALSMFGDYNTLLNNFLATDNAINIGRVNKGFMPYVMDEQALKLNNMSENKKRQEALIQIFRVYNNTIKDTLRTNKYKGKVSYGAYISSSVESIFDNIDEVDLGQFRRLIELKVSGNDLFPDKETVEKYEEIIETNKGMFLKDFVALILYKIANDENIIKDRYNLIRQSINVYYNEYFENLEKLKINSNATDIKEAVLEDIKARLEKDNIAITDREAALKTIERLIRNLKQVVKLDKKIALLLLTEELINETLDLLMNNVGEYDALIEEEYKAVELEEDSEEEECEAESEENKKIRMRLMFNDKNKLSTLKDLENNILDMQLSIDDIEEKAEKNSGIIAANKTRFESYLPLLGKDNKESADLVRKELLSLLTDLEGVSTGTIKLEKDSNGDEGYHFYTTRTGKGYRLNSEEGAKAKILAQFIILAADNNLHKKGYTDGKALRDRITSENYEGVEQVVKTSISGRRNGAHIYYRTADIADIKSSKKNRRDYIIFYSSNDVWFNLEIEDNNASQPTEVDTSNSEEKGDK